MMRLADITKDISNMSDDELREFVRQIRHNKTVVRPAAVKRQEEVVKKETNQQRNKVDKAIKNLSAEEKADLIKLLKGDSNG